MSISRIVDQLYSSVKNVCFKIKPRRINGYYGCKEGR